MKDTTTMHTAVQCKVSLAPFELSVTSLVYHMPCTNTSITVIIIIIVTTKLLTITLVSIILINIQQPAAYNIQKNYHIFIIMKVTRSSYRTTNTETRR